VRFEVKFTIETFDEKLPIKEFKKLANPIKGELKDLSPSGAMYKIIMPTKFNKKYTMGKK